MRGSPRVESRWWLNKGLACFVKPKHLERVIGELEAGKASQRRQEP